MDEQEIEVIYSPTGENRVALMKRGDRNFTFRHEHYLPPDPEHGLEADWERVYPFGNGLYDTRQRALVAAAKEVGWLRVEKDRTHCPGCLLK